MPYRMTPSVRHRAIEVHYYYYYYHQSVRQRVDSEPEPEPMIERCQLQTKIPLHGKRSLVACSCWTLIESWVFFISHFVCVCIIYFVFCNSRAVVTWKNKALLTYTYLLTLLVILQRKDTWNLVLVHLRKIPRSAGRKYRFSLQLYTNMHGFKYEFSKFFWGGAHRAPSQTPFPAQSQASPSILGRFASSVRAAPSIHTSNMFNNPSPNQGVLDQTLFSPNPNFLATPLDTIYRSKIT